MTISLGGWPVATAPDAAQPIDPLGSADSAFPAVAPVDEATWGVWARAFRRFSFEGRRVVVVAPHPDDETLGPGGLLCDLAGRGVEVQVVTVTSGEGSHRGWPGLGAVRQAEQGEALRALGVATAPICLGLPDGGVGDHTAELESALSELVVGADTLIAPWALDGHADHEAVGRTAACVGARTGASVLAHPIWAWQWATVDDLDGPSWQRWDLSPSSRRAKADAMDRYRSQTSDRHGPPVLPGEVLARASRSYEVYAHVA